MGNRSLEHGLKIKCIKKFWKFNRLLKVWRILYKSPAYSSIIECQKSNAKMTSTFVIYEYFMIRSSSSSTNCIEAHILIVFLYLVKPLHQKSVHLLSFYVRFSHALWVVFCVLMRKKNCAICGFFLPTHKTKIIQQN